MCVKLICKVFQGDLKVYIIYSCKHFFHEKDTDTELIKYFISCG